MSACAASHAFPYVKKRIAIIYHHSENLSPIDFAVDEMSKKVTELNEVVYQTKPDLKQLQLKLQGCVSAQVSKKVTELNEVVYQTKPDLKQLQLKLQGCVSAQVRVGSAQFVSECTSEWFVVNVRAWIDYILPAKSAQI